MSTETLTSASIPDEPCFTAFQGHQRLAAGPLQAVMREAARAAADTRSSEAVLVFDDATGAQTDLSVPAEPATRAVEAPEAPARQAGRPKLGVTAKEITLLPRHWEWLSLQPGGASVTLRRLVDEARRNQSQRDAVRSAQERCYRFLQAIAGNLPRYEDVLRALYRADAQAFQDAMADWPPDIRQYAAGLAASAFCGADAA